jgi:hypothetical protein
MKGFVSSMYHKGYLATILLSIVSLVSLLPLIFLGDSMNPYKVDIYLFSDHARWPENIAYDVCHHINYIVLVYTIWRLVPSFLYKKYVKCFFYVAILNMLGYFLFYSQHVSLFLIPLLITMLFITYFNNGNEERNNIG